MTTYTSISVASVADVQLAPGSVALVFTDPPYHDACLELYDQLGALAAHALRPGGYCLAYAGKAYLPQVLVALGAHLEYDWQFMVHHPYSRARFVSRRKFENYRPILCFRKTGGKQPRRWVQDVVKGVRSKRYHPWQQDAQAPERIIDAYTEPGDLVLDPFVGGGTTPAVCKALGRSCLAFDIAAEAVRIATERVAAVTATAGLAVTRRCANCGHPVRGRTDARFCSNACRQQAYRRRAELPPSEAHA